MSRRLELERQLRRIVDALRKLDQTTGACRRTNVSLEDCEGVLNAMEWEIAIELIAELCYELNEEGISVDSAIRENVVACAKMLSLPDPFMPANETTVFTYEQLCENFESQSADKDPAAFARLLNDHNIDKLSGVRMLRQIYGLDLKAAADYFDGVS